MSIVYQHRHLTIIKAVGIYGTEDPLHYRKEKKDARIPVQLSATLITMVITEEKTLLYLDISQLAPKRVDTHARLVSEMFIAYYFTFYSATFL